MSRQAELKDLIKENNRRLQKLREQQARKGIDTEPHILTEIEDIEAELERLQVELKELQEIAEEIELSLESVTTAPGNARAEAELSTGDVEIDGLALEAEDEKVLKAMFRGFSRVVVEAKFDRGLSGSRVFKTQLFDAAGHYLLPAVVKIASADLIAKEWQVYENLVKNKLPNTIGIESPPTQSPAGLGGLRYRLAGSGTFTLQSLYDYYHQASSADLRFVLTERLFRLMGQKWWEINETKPYFPLKADYDSILPVNLELTFSASAADKVDAVIKPGELPRLPMAVGQRIELRGFVVTEVEQEKERLTLNLPPAPKDRLPASYRPLKFSTLHGDLNLENILVDPESRDVSLIDFANVRQGHVLHDLLHLETEVVTKLISTTMAQPDLPPKTTLHSFYQRLHAAMLRLDSPTGPRLPSGLNKPLDMLVAIHQMARKCLFDPDDWTEYYQGLTLYLLGVLKFKNLDAHAKQVAFWAAATVVDLLTLTSPSPKPEYAYDVFISYSQADIGWVQGELLPLLEAADLKVFIDFRDFVPGEASLTSTEQGVGESRHTLVVLTPAWIESEWREFESVLAGTSDPAGRRRRVVPLKLAPCQPPPRIAMLVGVDLTNPARQEQEMARLLRGLGGKSA